MPVNHPAARFIELLTGSADTICTFAVLADHDGYAETPRAMRGRFQDVRAVLERENKRGAGIFLTMNETLGRRRRKTDVTGVRVLFVDGDKVERPDFWPIPPTIVQVRQTKWHAFWRLAPGEDIARWESAMRALAAVYGGDTAVCELARVMRLPGFLHHKDPDFPTSYALAETNDVLYAIDPVLAAHGIDPAAITAQAPVVASGPPVDGHDITDQEWLALETRLAGIIPTKRHSTLLNWTCDAFAAGMPDADIIDLMHAWILEHGRSPQPREVENAILFAREKSKAGTLKIHTPGVRPDLDFTVAKAETPAPVPLTPAAAAAQTADLVPWTDYVVRNKDGSWKSHVYNAGLIIDNTELKKCFQFNEFTHAVEVGTAPWRAGWEGREAVSREWVEDDRIGLAQWIAQTIPGRPTLEPAVIHSAIRPHTRRYTYHPVRQYLNGLTWDGVPRLATWLARYMGAEDNAYHTAIGTHFLIGAVARVMSPGYKFDSMLVLEGEQGLGKSRATRILFGDWFTDAAIDFASKDAAMTIRGKWGIELAEMHSASRAEASLFKSFISRQEDRQRDAFERCTVTYPRECVFIGTTNQEFYQTDDTGGRRIWPVACVRIDLRALGVDRNQLWGEAVHLFNAGGRGFLAPVAEALARVEQDRRHLPDPWIEVIASFVDVQDFDVSGTFKVTAKELFVSALGGVTQHMKLPDNQRIARCMRKLGFKASAIWKGGQTVRGYLCVRGVREA